MQGHVLLPDKVDSLYLLGSHEVHEANAPFKVHARQLWWHAMIKIKIIS